MVPKLCTAQASPRICGERVSLGMGEIKQPRRGRAGDAVPPSATTAKTYIRALQPVVQEAKNTRGTRQIPSAIISFQHAIIAGCLRDIASSRSASYKACTTPNETCSRAPTAGVSPGETRRSYLLQGSLMVDVSPRFTTSIGTWVWFLRHSACASVDPLLQWLKW